MVTNTPNLMLPAKDKNGYQNWILNLVYLPKYISNVRHLQDEYGEEAQDCAEHPHLEAHSRCYIGIRYVFPLHAVAL